MAVTIWHNPRCSKSRQTLALLENNDITPDVRLYLQDSPNAAEIKKVLAALGLSPRDLMRRGETDYKNQGLADVNDAAALIKAMVETPKLIERPVVINGVKAIIGRPPESVLDIL